MKKWIVIGAGSLLLGLSIVFGALFAGPIFAYAHSVSTSDTNPSDTKSHPYCDQYQQSLAKRLNVSVSTLQQDRQGAVSDVLAQMVKDGKLTQTQADAITKRVAAHQACAGFPRHAHVALSSLLKYRTDMLNSVAQGLHMSSDQLTSDLKAGQKLDAIAKAQNVSANDLKTLESNALNSALDKAVKAGAITQSQADALKQREQKHPEFVARVLQHTLHTKK